MKRFNNILLIFDTRSNMQAVRKHAESLAKADAARITLFSVIKQLPSNLNMAITAVPPQELIASVLKETRAQVDELADAMRQQGIDVSTKVLTGTPFLEIIRQVLREKHDLVMIAAEGKSGLKKHLFGSISMHLMRKCPCPVWVVKTTHRKRYKRILAAVDITSDFSDPEQDSLNSLILQLSDSMAKLDDSELHLVQVWSVYGEGFLSVRGGAGDEAIKKMRTLARQQYSSEIDKLLRDAAIDRATVVKHLPRSENISRSIVSLARSKKIDLLVMGTVCRTGVAGLLIGNTAEKVLNELDCSVLTVKPEGFVTPVKLK